MEPFHCAPLAALGCVLAGWGWSLLLAGSAAATFPTLAVAAGDDIREAAVSGLHRWQQEWAKVAYEAAERAIRSGEEEADEPEPGQAAQVLDCEGLGEGHGFWPYFRQVFTTLGPLAAETTSLAYQKWKLWEDFIDGMDAAGLFNGQITIPLPGAWYPNGTLIETVIEDRQHLLRVLQKVQWYATFNRPQPWSKDNLVGFMACPIGFVVVQYVIFLVHKTRSKLSPEDAKINWDSMVQSFGAVFGTPTYSLDHLESSGWGLSSFDIAANLHIRDNSFMPSYAAMCDERPIPPARLRPWREDWEGHRRWVAQGDACVWLPRAAQASEEPRHLRVALIGEHGPSNLEHLSALTAALEGPSCGARQLELEAAHFFTYLWALEGTEEGRALHSSLRMTWHAFWGRHLTESQGRDTSEAPQWTIGGAVWALREYASREPFLRAAQLLVCSEPLWLCALLHAARGPVGLLTRASSAGRVMGMLVDFEHVFGRGEVPNFWPLVRAFAEDVVPRGTVSATSRMTAEILAWQAGIRAPYVPFLSLHVARQAAYAPNTDEILLFRSQLPGAPSFFRLLRLLRAEMPDSPRLVHMTGMRSLGFSEMARYRAVAMLPHIPNALRLADMYSIGMPVLIPAAPLIHKYVWPRDPLMPLSLVVDGDAAGRSNPPFSPYEFMGDTQEFHSLHDERRYWLQYTEWEVRPHLIRFSSARDFLEKAAMSAEAFREVSARMLEAQAEMRKEALEYWRLALAAAVETPS